MKFFLFIYLLAVTSFSYAQDATNAIKQAGQFESAMNDEQAILKYKEALTLDPSNIYVLCKCSELCSRIAARIKDDKTKQDALYHAAETYARAAYKQDPSSSEANFVMAMVMGRNVETKGGKDKIDAVKAIKKYAGLAVRLDPGNYKAWFVLGKWYYEIDKLNYFERTAVRLFFGALPPATIEDAINCFEKVKSLSPGFLLGYLELAKAYKKKEEESIARKNLAIMLTLPDKTQDDEGIKNQGKDLLKKWD